MMDRKGETKRQHYVPRMILRNFSKDGRRISLMIDGKRIPETSIATQCYEDYFYGADNVMEKAFAAKEGEIAEFLGDLNPEKFRVLTAERVEQLRIFLAFQHARTRGAANHHSKFVGAFAKYAALETARLNSDLDALSEEFEMFEPEPENAQHDALWHAAKAMPILLDMQVRFIYTDRQPGFVIADNPVVAYNQFAEHHPVLSRYPTSTALGHKGLQLFLPLSPSLMLAMFDSTSYDYAGRGAVCTAGPRDVMFLNRMQAVNAVSCLYFHGDRSDASSLEKLATVRTMHPSVYTKHVSTGQVEDDGSGRKRQFVAVYQSELRLGARLSFVRTTDREKYTDYVGPSVPPRSPELMRIAKEFGEELERERAERHARASSAADGKS